jgi:hypothetical protein
VPTTKYKSSHKSNAPAIAGGIIGGAAAISLVIGIVVFVQRRQRPIRPISMLSDSLEDTPQVITAPFNPIPSETTQDSGVSGEREAEMVAIHGLSSTSPFVLSRPVAPIPVGLSGKELARLRTEALSSERSHNPSTSDLNVSQPTSSPSVANESSGAASSYDPRRLQSEVESLRREMERMRTEGLVVTGAPPSYTEGAQ